MTNEHYEEISACVTPLKARKLALDLLILGLEISCLSGCVLVPAPSGSGLCTEQPPRKK